ncbi:hypothetical protein JRO89_XS14G0052500 [Xanthoceras sorbifolium]|uniref:Retrotransposon Copia-like N-terminal domain-containing protein n=1 Tax=Xanthoceras sorbifolium TaxID=99658 RepID=A0ABQ8H3Z1_9ROSI|nr:hypothetical protein JRO89_XS14G0052500 [Xanthoceras sorbifolium]
MAALSSTNLTSPSMATVAQNSGSQTSSAIKLNFNLPIKLDRNNYLFWKVQVLPVIRAYNLEEYIFEIKPSPNKYVESRSEDSSEVVKTLNSEFLA